MEASHVVTAQRKCRNANIRVQRTRTVNGGSGLITVLALVNVVVARRHATGLSYRRREAEANVVFWKVSERKKHRWLHATLSLARRIVWMALGVNGATGQSAVLIVKVELSSATGQ